MNTTFTLNEILKIFYYSFGIYMLLGMAFELYQAKKFNRKYANVAYARNMIVLIIGLVLNQIILAVLSQFIEDKTVLLSIFLAVFWLVFFVMNLPIQNQNEDKKL